MGIQEPADISHVVTLEVWKLHMFTGFINRNLVQHEDPCWRWQHLL